MSRMTQLISIIISQTTIDIVITTINLPNRSKRTLETITRKTTDYNKLVKNLVMPPGISTSSDPNTIAQIIVDATTEAIKKSTKTQTFTVKHSDNLSNWTSDEVLATMMEKDKWLKKRRRKPHSEYYKCQLENTTIKLEAVTRKAISNFIRLKTSVKEPKKMWRNINSLLGRKLKNKITELKRRDGTLTCNAKEIADELNRFFASCSDMLNKTPNSTAANTSLEIPVQQSMYLKPTDITEDIDTIDSLKSGSAAGSDGIDPKAIKALKHQLALSLVTLVNKIFEMGCTRKHLKQR